MKFGWSGLMGIAIAATAAMPARAADLPAYGKVPSPMIAATYDWSGFYTGFNGGWGSAKRCFDQSIPAVATDSCQNVTGAIAGAQVGFRWQTGGWVFGLEGQGDWANLRGSSPSVVNAGFINRSRIDAFGLFTGQLGYAFDTALLYAKGGGAVVSDRNDMLNAGALAATTAGDNRWGATAGAGVEWAFAQNWSAAVEYNHLFIGNRTATFNTPPPATAFSTDRIQGDADLVSVRINYRWGGPVISKY